MFQAPNDHRMTLNGGQMYPINVPLVPPSPMFHSVLLYDYQFQK